MRSEPFSISRKTTQQSTAVDIGRCRHAEETLPEIALQHAVSFGANTVPHSCRPLSAAAWPVLCLHLLLQESRRQDQQRARVQGAR